MTIAQLRRAKDRLPFSAFDIRIADGQRIRIPHPEFLYIPPKAERTFIVSYEDGTVQVIDLLLVTTLDFDTGRTSGNGRPRRNGRPGRNGRKK